MLKPQSAVSTLIRRNGWLVGLYILFQSTALPALAAPNVTIGQNFLASSFETNSQAIPPDANGVIGPQYFVEFINGEFACFDRTDPGNVFRESDLIFWSDAGINLSSSQAVTDPRIIWDPLSQRWFASMVDFDANASDPTTEANDFLLAYSDTSDPTGNWTGFRITADTSTNHAFADFPTLGVDSNAVYLSGNMFKGGNNNLGPNLLSIPKADLLNTNTHLPSTATYFGVLNPAIYGWVLQVGTCFDASTNCAILSMGDIGSDSNEHSNIFTFRVLGPGRAGATLSTPIQITVNPYVCPFNSDQGAPLFTATQPDGTQDLQANDPRFAAKVYRVGDVLFGVHNTEFNNRIAIQWYRVSATNGVLLEQGMISDTDLDLFYPSIAANTNGTVVIGCNGSSIDTYISSYAYVGQTASGVTTFGSSILLLAGMTNYQGEDVAIEGNSDSRWGDYSAMSVDPANPTDFWTIQMYPSDVDDSIGSLLGDPSYDFGVWSTQVTELLITQLSPQLTVTPSGANVLLSWPASAASFQLQANTSLISSNWVTITPSLSTNGSVISALVPITGSQNFFRLKQ